MAKILCLQLLTYGVLIGPCLAQNCPLLGPAYPPPTDPVSSSFLAAAETFDGLLKLDSRIDRQRVSFAVQVYSSSSTAPMYSHYSTAPFLNTSKVGPDTLFRIHSISKVMTVYAIISKLGHKYWDEPVTKYVPELAVRPQRDGIGSPDWSEVTLGGLASQMSGISRDYALGDISTAFTEMPFSRPLNQSELVRCGSTGFKPCTREEAIKLILSTYPVSAASSTPNYSNMAFQILAYAIETITQTPFPDLVRAQLIQPLNLTRTFLTNPGNDTNAVIYNGWDLDFGDEAPTAGYYQSVSDLTTLGRSIISSTLMPAISTRKWLKPVTHTSSLVFSLGRPWEILRQTIPISTSPSTSTSRVTDIYTKQGGGDTYTSLIALSPDHNIGISITSAGPSSFSSGMEIIRDAFMDIWLPAAEQAAREQARRDLAGTYMYTSSIDNSSSLVTVAIETNQPGLFVSKMVSNGTDMLALIAEYQQRGEKGTQLGMWLYPAVGLTEGNRTAFRGVLGLVGRPAAADCGSWAEGDRLRWGNYPVDLLIFETEGDGRAERVEVPVLGRSLERA
ncbi:beta-lactamase/transpeptidase-like protein [Rhypophila decipiens]|uniref:Beta-lactamase/transpeptidase-like protein n=1 Tax=Rhypophila decipiens TaxID=261697 RepID=A0AAN7B9I8_9PEZI|nr:beta-lactamase/transpeptidase-like protein [Rhypophila decipiens]